MKQSQSLSGISKFILVGLGVVIALLGLALAAGGVGVANAVGAFLDGKRQVIASFKSLGAPGHLIVTIYMIQILAIASIAGRTLKLSPTSAAAATARPPISAASRG